MPTKYLCYLCGEEFDTLDAILKHLKMKHKVHGADKEPGSTVANVIMTNWVRMLIMFLRARGIKVEVVEGFPRAILMIEGVETVIKWAKVRGERLEVEIFFDESVGFDKMGKVLEILHRKVFFAIEGCRREYLEIFHVEVPGYTWKAWTFASTILEEVRWWELEHPKGDNNP